jgi:hypothetical protein
MVAHIGWSGSCGTRRCGSALALAAGVGAHYSLSLFPVQYPAADLPVCLAAIDHMSQIYVAWSVGASALATAMLIFSLAVLWSARKLPPQTLALFPAHEGLARQATRRPRQAITFA